MSPHDAFPPTDDAARARIDALDPAAYARTRNHLDGAVSRLSPYLTHGIVTPAQVLAGIARRQPIAPVHRFVFELGWRAYFRHVWSHRGDDILASLHPGPLPDDAYARTIPDDVLRAATGVPAIDRAVRTLYADGWMHNHARMWLASYLVHLREVHWRTGADWMLGLLLDGDLASNHLSWQWVAGTASRKPYLFNADNVARWAPAAWHSAGSAIDAGYDVLDAAARSPAPWPPAPAAQSAPKDAAAHAPEHARAAGMPGPLPTPPALLPAPPPGVLAVRPPAPRSVAGRDVWLVHPWALRAPPSGVPADALRIGVLFADLHAARPWSATRWRFAGTAMRALVDTVWLADTRAVAEALRAARSVRAFDEPHVAPLLRGIAQCEPEPALFAPVKRPCGSFSQWWTRTMRGVRRLEDLPGFTASASPG